MSTTKGSTKTPAPVNPGEAYESLLLLSYRWVNLVAASAPMAAHALTVPGFVALAAAAAEPDSALGKIARKAGLDRTAAVEAVRGLRAAGLLEQARRPDGKGASVSVTEKGRETLAAVRAGFAEAAAGIPEANWRAVPRVAAILRIAGRPNRITRRAKPKA